MESSSQAEVGAENIQAAGPETRGALQASLSLSLCSLPGGLRVAEILTGERLQSIPRETGKGA